MVAKLQSIWDCRIVELKLLKQTRQRAIDMMPVTGDNGETLSRNELVSVAITGNIERLELGDGTKCLLTRSVNRSLEQKKSIASQALKFPGQANNSK